MSKNLEHYWATLPTKEFIPEFYERVKDYYTMLNDTGRMDRMQRNYRHFYGQGTSTVSSSNRLTSVGDSGEYTTLKINDYRSIVNHAVILTVQGRPALMCQAKNTDVESKQQTRLGNAILEQQLKAEKVEKDLKLAATWAMLYDEAYTLTLWNQNLGDVARVIPEEVKIDEETGEETVIPEKAIRSGKLEHFVFGPADVPRDVRMRTPKSQWYAFRIQMNRWDLITNYPAFKDELLGISDFNEYMAGVNQFIVPIVPRSEADVIDCWLFMHEKTAAVPNGRYALIIGDFAITDIGLPYRKMPVGRIAPGEQDQTGFGYSDANDLVAIQELRDAIVSIIASNEVTFGGQNIAVKKGWGGSRTQLGSFANIFELENPQTDIVPLEMVRTAPELFKFNEYLDGKQGQLMGINPTVRGNPQQNIKSGTAQALQDSKAMQFLQGLQESYNQLLESEGVTIIEVLQDCADEPQLVDLAGKANKSVIRQMKYTRKDINKIAKVTVQSVNPLSQTFSGRLQIAQDLLQKDLIQRPEQYLQVLETGRLEPLYGDELADLQMIDAENEALQDGQPVLALITDLHKAHIQGHRSLLNDPATRISDPKLRERVQLHILEHLRLLSQAAQMNPLLLWSIGEEMPPMAPAPPGQPPQGGAGGPQGPALNPQPASPAGVMQAPADKQSPAKLPSMPSNPSTGEKTPRMGGSDNEPQ